MDEDIDDFYNLFIVSNSDTYLLSLYAKD